MTPREQIAAAMRDGVRAALAGEPLSACPYRIGESEFEDLLGTLWCRAFDRVAGLPVEFESVEDQG